MPLRYPEIADAAFATLHQRPPAAPRAIALAYAKSREEFTMDVIAAGKGHLNVAERLKKFVPGSEEVHTTTIT